MATLAAVRLAVRPAVRSAVRLASMFVNTFSRVFDGRDSRLVNSPPNSPPNSADTRVSCCETKSINSTVTGSKRDVLQNADPDNERHSLRGSAKNVGSDVWKLAL